MDFKNSTIKQMKEFIREYNKTHSDKIKGYSKLKKADLAKFLEEYTSIKRKPQFSKKAQEKIKKTPIPGKALFSDIKGEEKILTKEEALRKKEPIESKLRVYRVVLKKYQLEQFLKEIRPDIPKKILRLNKNKLVDYIRDNIPQKEWKPTTYFEKYSSPYKTVKFEDKLGLEKLKPGETLEQDFGAIPYNKGTEPIAINSEPITLQAHQKKFLEGFLIGNLRSAIAFHGVGTGKTLTAVACARFYLQLYPKNRVIIITPTAVLFNFIEAMALYGVDPRDTRYKYYTYQKFYLSKDRANNALLIVDEAHNFRSPMEIFEDIDGKYVFGKTNKRGIALWERGGIPADKVLLLTATPFVNRPYDIENLLAIGDGREPLDQRTFGDVASNNRMRRDYFNYRISYFTKEKDSKFFPERREQLIGFIAPDSDKDIKAVISVGQNEFYSQSRQASLAYEGKKFEYVITRILNSDDKKFVVYTTFIKNGVNVLERVFDKFNISYGLISGQQNTTEKAMAIDGYNNYEDEKYLGPKYQVLIITKAGSEGVNLLRTRGIFVIDGQWNDATYEQIVARAIRFKSHFDLPKEEQYVDVMKLMVVYANEDKLIQRINKGVKFDYNKMLIDIQEKRKEYKVAKMEIDKKIRTKVDPNFDIDEFMKMKKGSEERKQYIEENLRFGKKREFHVVDKLLESIPSTDFYMFILQKVKQGIIDDFVHEIETKTEPLENSIYKLPEHEELMKIFMEEDLDYEEVTKFIIDYYEPLIGKSIKLFNKDMKIEKTRLDQFLEKRKDLNKLQKQRARLRLNQEYFTPKDVIKRMIDISGLKKIREKKFTQKILEPTAGYGNIVSELLNVMKINKIPLDITMVEILDENREQLQKFVDLLPDVCELAETKDFLQYIPSDRFDYIFMNPPFFLRKSKRYKRNYYDIDFVKRAYTMLKNNGGVLTAIVGQGWKKRPEQKEWLEEVGADITNDTIEWKETGKGGKASEFEKLKVSFIRIFKNVEPGDEAEDIMEDREIIKETQVISQDEPVQSEAQAEPVQRKGIRRRRK